MCKFFPSHFLTVRVKYKKMKNRTLGVDSGDAANSKCDVRLAVLHRDKFL